MNTSRHLLVVLVLAATPVEGQQPSDADLLAEAVYALEQRKDCRASIAALNDMSEVAKQDPMWLGYRAKASESCGDLREALAFWEEYDDRVPGSGEVRETIGRLRYEIRSAAKAEAERQAEQRTREAQAEREANAPPIGELVAALARGVRGERLMNVHDREDYEVAVIPEQVASELVFMNLPGEPSYVRPCDVWLARRYVDRGSRVFHLIEVPLDRVDTVRASQHRGHGDIRIEATGQYIRTFEVKYSNERGRIVWTPKPAEITGAVERLSDEAPRFHRAGQFSAFSIVVKGGEIAAAAARVFNAAVKQCG